MILEYVQYSGCSWLVSFPAQLPPSISLRFVGSGSGGLRTRLVAGDLAVHIQLILGLGGCSRSKAACSRVYTVKGYICDQTH